MTCQGACLELYGTVEGFGMCSLLAGYMRFHECIVRAD